VSRGAAWWKLGGSFDCLDISGLLCYTILVLNIVEVGESSSCLEREWEEGDMEALELQEYDEWLAEHLDELVARYPAKVVAIHEGKIISIGDTEADIYRRVREAGLEPMPLVFRIPREEDLQSIL
jgi:hypothetical protein